jgi:hypothetical protein
VHLGIGYLCPLLAPVPCRADAADEREAFCHVVVHSREKSVHKSVDRVLIGVDMLVAKHANGFYDIPREAWHEFNAGC